MRLLRKFSLCLAVLAIVTISTSSSRAASGARPLITEKIDGSKLVTLPGNVPAYTLLGRDTGSLADGHPLNHMLLVLKRSPEQQQALDQVMTALHTQGSGSFHQWLTPSEFGSTFGLAQSDLTQITGWLQSEGFHVDAVSPNGLLIEFSGTVGNVRNAFQTDIHGFQLNGQSYFAPVSEPKIPAALSAAVVGPTLHNFFPTSMLQIQSATSVKPIASAEAASASGLNGTAGREIGPQDFATIYNVRQAWQKNLSGSGQTIAVVGDSELKNASDVANFLNISGLSGYKGTFSQTAPAGANTCQSAGVTSHEAEAAADAEWAAATAPGARVVLAACANSSTVFGGVIAALNLINGASVPQIISMGYSQREDVAGAATNALYKNLYEQAAAEGVSVFVGSAVERQSASDTAVNALSSTAFNVAVGGTEFAAASTSAYWATALNLTESSAKSYVPEVPFSGAEILGTSGVSSCALSGLGCAGWPKPEWQTGVLGIRADGLRDVPDVSLFSSPSNASSLRFCMSDTAMGGAACSASRGQSGSGTSFAASAFAGIQALINQSQKGAQGNANYVLYGLGAKEFGTSGQPNAANLSSCNSGNGRGVGAGCVFYNVSSDTSTGYSSLTGIGSVNVANLIAAWKGYSTGDATTTSKTTLSVAPAAPANYQSITCSITVLNSAGASVPAPSGTVTLYENSTSTILGQATLTPNGANNKGQATITLPPYTLAGNTTPKLFVIYTGDGTYFASQSPNVSVPVSEPGTEVTLSSSVSTMYKTTDSTVLSVHVVASGPPSGGAPLSGQVVFTSNGSPIGTVNIVPVNGSSPSQGNASFTANEPLFSPGVNTVSATYQNDPDYGSQGSDQTATVTVYYVELSTAGKHNFGAVPVGSSVQYGVQVKNTTPVPFPFSMSTAAFGSAFSETNDCPTMINPGAHCNLLFTYHPPTAGNFDSGSYTVATSNYVFVAGNGAGSNGGPNGGILDGQGQSSTGLVLNTSNYDFGAQASGVASSPFSLVIKNSTSSTLTPGYSFSDQMDFVVNYTACPSTLNPGASCTITVTFDPQTQTQISGTLTISGTGSTPIIAPGKTGVAPYTVTFSGTGVNGSTAGLTVNTGGHNFGQVEDGSTSGVYGTQITNVYSYPVHLTLNTSGPTYFPIYGPGTDCFTKYGGSLTLPANGGSCFIAFEFQPTGSIHGFQGPAFGNQPANFNYSITGTGHGTAVTLYVAGDPRRTTIYGVRLVGTACNGSNCQ